MTGESREKRWDVLTVGETMVVFIPEQKQPFRYVDTFRKGIAGAESNVAIGLSKLGHSSCWMSKVGNDELGEFILKEIRGEGVDVTEVIKEKDMRTGLMIKEFRSTDETSVFYYRENSAASTLSRENIREDLIKRAKIVHLTGITSALSSTCAEMNLEIAHIAKIAGILISFDPNIRLKLWDRKRIRDTLTPLLKLCDVIEIGVDEADVLLNTNRTESIIQLLREKGIQKIALKLGRDGAVVADDTQVYEIPAYIVETVDNIGAGDAFAAGFLCGIIENQSLLACGRMGAVMGAQAVRVPGDIEGLPDRRRLDMLLQGNRQNYR